MFLLNFVSFFGIGLRQFTRIQQEHVSVVSADSLNKENWLLFFRRIQILFMGSTKFTIYSHFLPFIKSLRSNTFQRPFHRENAKVRHLIASDFPEFDSLNKLSEQIVRNFWILFSKKISNRKLDFQMKNTTVCCDFCGSIVWQVHYMCSSEIKTNDILHHFY